MAYMNNEVISVHVWVEISLIFITITFFSGLKNNVYGLSPKESCGQTDKGGGKYSDTCIQENIYTNTLLQVDTMELGNPRHVQIGQENGK